MSIKKTTLAMFSGLLLTAGSYTVSAQNANLPTAVQGTLGDDSTGKVGIALQVGSDDGSDSILIQRLGSLDLGTFGEDASLTGSIDFCVYRTGSPNGFDFNMAVESTNGAPDGEDGAFVLASASDLVTTTIGYDAVFNDKVQESGTNYPLTQSATNSVKAFASPLITNSNGVLSCSGDNVSLKVAASFADASVAQSAADYTDTLTLTVSPL